MMKARKSLATFKKWKYSWQSQYTWLATSTPTKAQSNITTPTRTMRTSINSSKKNTAGKSSKTMSFVKSCRKTSLTLKKVAIGLRRVTSKDLINF